MKKGFTLIEAMSVVAIIGILVTIGIYVAQAAQRQARDAKRKSDLTQISNAFITRYNDETCQSGFHLYPGNNVGLNPKTGKFSWATIETIQTNTDKDLCKQPLSTYLPTLPSDPDTAKHYYFALNGPLGGQIGKYFRVTAALEKTLTAQEILKCKDASSSWKKLDGSEYDCASPNAITSGDYNYYLGQ